MNKIEAKNLSGKMTEAEAIDKFKDKILTRHGRFNVRTVQQIAEAAGLEKPVITYDERMYGLYIEGFLANPNGRDAIKYLFRVCSALSDTRTKRKMLLLQKLEEHAQILYSRWEDASEIAGELHKEYGCEFQELEKEIVDIELQISTIEERVTSHLNEVSYE